VAIALVGDLDHDSPLTTARGAFALSCRSTAPPRATWMMSLADGPRR